MALLEFAHVKKSFSSHKVLKDVSFDVEQGEIIGLAGKSGGGKTTLMRVLMGFYHADGGKILFEGKDVSRDLYHLRQNIGFTTQDNSFYEKLTVFENLEYFGQMYGVDEKSIRDRVPMLLGLLELNGKENLLAEDLSGGMKRRLDFAISLIHDPHILILDEPTTGLDPMLREQIWKVIQNIRGFGKTVIVSTHFFDELELYCDRVVILHNGIIVGMQSPKWYATTYYKDFAKTFSYILRYHDLQEADSIEVKFGKKS
jgi:ABC-type multidrug transport system ATPase subunit